MCIICVQFENEKLTKREAYQAIGEMVNTDEISADHALEVMNKLDEAEEEEVIITPLEDDVKLTWRGFDDEIL